MAGTKVERLLKTSTPYGRWPLGLKCAFSLQESTVCPPLWTRQLQPLRSYYNTTVSTPLRPRGSPLRSRHLLFPHQLQSLTNLLKQYPHKIHGVAVFPP
jgi:hypothetical protein